MLARRDTAIRTLRLLAWLLGFAILWRPAATVASGPPNGLIARCSGARSATRASPAFLIIDCAPGFASPRDRISVYPRSPVQAGARWQNDLNQTNAVWLFDAGATGRASLVIDFHPNRHGSGVVADLYDDQDGDGRVTTTLRDGVPFPAETPFPTVRVVAPAGWWVKDGTVNFNLDLTVDGPVYSAFGSELYLDRLKTDGRPDFEITVRDQHGNGRPDVEWINAWPDAPNSSGIYRTEVMVNTAGNEVPITNDLFWPYLGSAFAPPLGFKGRQSPTTGSRPPDSQSDGFVKDYGKSFPPIQVYWPAGKIASVGEFVASRGSSANWFLYSLNRLGPNQEGDADFENPFAFYDLAGAADGYPDLAIRQEYYGPADPRFDAGRFDRASQQIRYTWDQHHDHTWSYKLDLIGRHPIDTTVRAGPLSLRSVPYQSYPRWVTGRTWDAADFVAAEKPVWTTEGIYPEFSGLITFLNEYVTGRASTPPGADLADVPPGYRGEFSFDLHSQPYLYLSLIDHKLHLLRATAGSWNLGHGREVRYANLGGDHIDEWQALQDGTTVSTLYYVAGQLLLVNKDGLQLRRVDRPAAIFTTLPPTSRRTWAQLGELLKQHAAPFSGADLEAMFQQCTGPTQTLPRAALSDVHLTRAGFRFVLLLPDGGIRDVAWTDDLPPGRYLVTFTAQHGYSAEPIRSVALLLSRVRSLGEPVAALQPVRLRVSVTNRGNVDTTPVTVDFVARAPDGTDRELGSTAIEAPANGTATAEVPWTPPAAGTWEVRARVLNHGPTAAPLVIEVAPAPLLDLQGWLALSALPDRTALGLGFLLAVTGLAASAAWLTPWLRGPVESATGHAADADDA